MLGARNGGSLAKPPRVRWELGPGKKYAVFLSHYKDEAGMEARYLRDLLQKVLLLERGGGVVKSAFKAVPAQSSCNNNRPHRTTFVIVESVLVLELGIPLVVEVVGVPEEAGQCALSQHASRVERR